MVPPALTRFETSSFSGAKPSSWISSAYPFTAMRTASVERNTSVSCAEATEAFATTNPTVALSVSFFACVIETQIFPGMSAVLSSNEVTGVFRSEERVPGHAAPGGDVVRRSEIRRGELEDGAGLHAAQPHREQEDELTAPHAAGIPRVIRVKGIVHVLDA